MSHRLDASVAAARLILVCAWLALGCTESAAVECKQAEIQHSLVNGTTRSAYVYLDVVEERALLGLSFPGYDGWCSGTLIAPAAVLTAAHCLQAAKPQADDTYQLAVVSGTTSLGVFAASARFHDALDVALLLLDTPQLPIQAMPLEVDRTSPGLGELLQIQGYGYDEQGQLGNLRFAVSPVLTLSEMTFAVGTSGRNGLCGGDSGASALRRSANGAVVVSGVLTNGAASCRGDDEFVLGAAIGGWVEDVVQGSPRAPGANVGDSPCAQLGSRGRCFGQSAVWCDASGVRGQACDAPAPCGWSTADSGFRCVRADEDPCSGISDLGSCEDDVARVCDDGVLRTSPCQACGAKCSRDPASGLARCSVSN